MARRPAALTAALALALLSTTAGAAEVSIGETIDPNRLRVCAELNNAWMERFLYRDLAERSHLIGIVQVNDFAEGTLATPQRVPPGDGIIPLRRILAALARSGYPGFLELELIGPEIERMGYEEAIRRSMAFLDSLQED